MANNFLTSVKCDHIRQNGEKCKAPAIARTTKCRKHGGLVQLQKQDGFGLYYKNQPMMLKDLTEEQLANPHLMDLRQQIGVTSGILAYAFEQIKKKEASLKRGEELTDLTELLGIARLSDQISSMIERCTKIGIAVRMLVHIDTIERMLEEWVGIARNFIPSDKRTEFAQQLEIRAAAITHDASQQVFFQPGPPIKQLRQLRVDMKIKTAQARSNARLRKQKSYTGKKSIYGRKLRPTQAS